MKSTFLLKLHFWVIVLALWICIVVECLFFSLETILKSSSVVLWSLMLLLPSNQRNSLDYEIQIKPYALHS